MALKSELMASGMSGAEANRLGLDGLATLTATGASQGAAAPLLSNFTNVNAGSGAGVILSQSHAMHCIINTTGGNVLIYPPVGGTINPSILAQNAAFTLTTGKTALIITGGTNFFANMSA